MSAQVISSEKQELMSCVQGHSGKALAGQIFLSNLVPIGRTPLALTRSVPSSHTVTALRVIKAPYSDTSFHLETSEPLIQSTSEFLKVRQLYLLAFRIQLHNQSSCLHCHYLRPPLT